jgi:hypothetical protein
MLATAETRVLAVSALLTIAVGTVFYTFIEGWTPVQALYFCVVTLATVGYGDLHPTTELSQLFTVGYILTGIGIIAAFATELAKLRSVRPLEHEPAAGEQKVVELTEDESR